MAVTFKTPKLIAERIARLAAGIVVSDLHAAKRRREGSRWYFRVRDPRQRTPDGKPRYVAKAWASFDEGEKWANDEAARLRLGLVTSDKALMSELGPAYVASLATRARTERYQGQVEQAWKAMVAAGADNLKDPMVHQRVEAWLGNLQTRRHGAKKQRPASARTRNQLLTIVNAIIGYAMALPTRPLTYNPLASVRRWPTLTKAKRVFTAAELRRLVSDEARFRPRVAYDETLRAMREHGENVDAAAKALRVHPTTVRYRLDVGPQGEDPWWRYTMLGIYLGARPTEIRHLKWTMIDWHNGDLVMPADHPGNKTDVERRVQIMSELLDEMRSWYRVGDRGYILAPEIVEMRPDVASKAFQAYVGRCGVDATARGPHTLRHNCGALLTALGWQDVRVLLHLGHENVTVSKEYRRSAPSFRHDVKEWGDHFRLRTPAARAASRKRSDGAARPTTQGVS